MFSGHSLGTLIDSHRQAFSFFGGVPGQVLYDNMKQVRLDDGQLNPAWVEFAAHHGFAIKTCRVRRARTKGKVERMVDYVKDNFLLGRAFADLEDLNTQARAWLDNTAHLRVHATTGHRPADLLASEREHLTPLESLRPYPFVKRYPLQKTHCSSGPVTSASSSSDATRLITASPAALLLTLPH